MTSFNKYSNYQNLQYVLNMSTAYNYAMVEAGVDEVEGYLTIDGQNGMPVIETQKIYDLYAEKYGTEEDQYIILSSENEESKADLLVTYSGGNLYYQTRLDGQKGFLILAQKLPWRKEESNFHLPPRRSTMPRSRRAPRTRAEDITDSDGIRPPGTAGKISTPITNASARRAKAAAFRTARRQPNPS